MIKRAATGLFLLSFLLSLAGCKRGDVEQKEASAAGERPNVLLITLDTTRADRIGCYGHGEAETPVIDALAASGIRFERAFCQVPLTLPSHATIHTGIYPPGTGLAINGHGALASDATTLAEVFKKRGYRTGAFVAAVVLKAAFGLDRGFDVYEDSMDPGEGTRAGFVERRGDRVCDSALTWLGEKSEAPFFAWVHLYDPHEPYDPPAPYSERFTNKYDGEIAFADAQVGRIMKWLETSGVYEQTLVVVVGDHGEAFGEHGEMTHGLFIYNTTMHVPLIVSFPTRLTTPRVIAEDVRVIDIFPTILALLDVPQEDGIDGVSLASACRTGEAAPLPVYGECLYSQLGFGWAPLRSLQVRQWKYIEAPRAELYDLEADPGELKNVISEHDDTAMQFREELGHLRDSMTKRAAGVLSRSNKYVDQLASLGYVGGSALPLDEDEDRPRRDPKDMVSVERGFGRAVSRLRERKFDEIVNLLTPLIELSPESDCLYGPLGMALLELGRNDEAEQAYRASLRTVADSADNLWGLGESLRRQNKIADAMSCFRACLEVMPDHIPSHRGLGMAYFAQGKLNEAYAYSRKHIELAPTSANALTNIAVVLQRMGRISEAISSLREAVKHEPGNEMAVKTLCSGLRALGKRAELLTVLRNAHRAAPENNVLTSRLAWALATAPDPSLRKGEEAVTLARSCCYAEPSRADFLDVLAAAYAEAGDMSKAVETGRRALSLAGQQRATVLQQQIGARLRVYEAGQPYRE